MIPRVSDKSLRSYYALNTATLLQWGGLAFLNFILQALPAVLGVAEGVRAAKSESRKRAQIREQEEKDAKAYRDNLKRAPRSQGGVEGGGGAFSTALKQITGA